MEKIYSLIERIRSKMRATLIPRWNLTLVENRLNFSNPEVHSAKGGGNPLGNQLAIAGRLHPLESFESLLELIGTNRALLNEHPVYFAVRGGEQGRVDIRIGGLYHDPEIERRIRGGMAGYGPK